MIRTVTLNPALDKTVEINNFNVGLVNRVLSIRLDAGGKGINVSKMVSTLGGKSTAFGFIAGRTGDYIKGCLDRSGIENDFVYTDGETRTNMKIIDSIQHANTDINEPGPNIPPEKIMELENKVFRGIDDKTVLVLSGSIPSGVPADIYRKWIEKARESGTRMILDCDGELLREGIKAAPYLIKPNIHELEGLLKRNISGIDEMVSASRDILKMGVKIVVLSLGSQGALFVKDDIVIHADGIKVDVKSTVGAGDSMVAALAYALDSKMDFEKAAVLAVASGTAKVTTSGSQPPEMEKIMSVQRLVKFKFI